jgi:hypothetical protein
MERIFEDYVVYCLRPTLDEYIVSKTRALKGKVEAAVLALCAME